MRTISPGLAAHIAQETTTLATIFQVTRTDGKVFSYTTHDSDLDVGGTIYKAAAGVTPSQLAQTGSLAVDNLDFVAILDNQDLQREELLYGFFDYASLVISLVNWEDTTQVLELMSGRLGEISLGDQRFTTEMRSLTQHLDATHGRIVTIDCDVEVFGAGRCGLNKLSFATNYSVQAVPGTYNAFEITGGQAGTTGYYQFGECLFQTGANAGFEYQVASHAAPGAVIITARTPHAIQVGDSVQLIAGCDRRFETCKTKFSNGLNFQGFPHVPGRDSLLETPDAQ